MCGQMGDMDAGGESILRQRSTSLVRPIIIFYAEHKWRDACEFTGRPRPVALRTARRRPNSQPRLLRYDTK